MSAEDMRRISIQRLEEMRKNGINKMRQVRYQPPSPVAASNGSLAVLPPNTAEAIGLLHCEIAAELNAIDRSIDILNDVYRMLTSPAQQPDDTEGEKREDYY